MSTCVVSRNDPFSKISSAVFVLPPLLFIAFLLQLYPFTGLPQNSCTIGGGVEVGNKICVRQMLGRFRYAR